MYQISTSTAVNTGEQRGVTVTQKSGVISRSFAERQVVEPPSTAFVQQR